MCVFKLPRVLNALEQIEHLNGFSPVWIRICNLRWDGLGKPFPQYGHRLTVGALSVSVFLRSSRDDPMEVPWQQMVMSITNTTEKGCSPKILFDRQISFTKIPKSLRRYIKNWSTKKLKKSSSIEKERWIYVSGITNKIRFPTYQTVKQNRLRHSRSLKINFWFKTEIVHSLLNLLKET